LYHFTGIAEQFNRLERPAAATFGPDICQEKLPYFLFEMPELAESPFCGCQPSYLIPLATLQVYHLVIRAIGALKPRSG
jgi:hypothetical protein